MQLADARVSERPLFSERDRWFESAFLHRRVGGEPDFRFVRMPEQVCLPERLVGPNWAAHARSLGINAVGLDALLAEIAATGNAVLFIDGIDRIEIQDRANASGSQMPPDATALRDFPESKTMNKAVSFRC